MRNVDNKITVKTRVASLFICLILTVIAAVPVCAPDVSAKPSSSESNKSRIIVSLGDSYSSGEGIPPFYGQDAPLDEKVKNPDWLAHRSEKSWGGRLKLKGVTGTMADNRGKNWFFAASSGATTYHLNNTQVKDLEIKDAPSSASIERQLDIFKNMGGKKAEYVTISIGGNDAQFSEVVTTAVIPHPINPGSLNDKLAAVWNEFYYGTDNNKSIRERLKDAYYDIQSEAGIQAKIIVAGYPKLITPNGKIPFFSSDDAALINDSVSRFNDEIESVVKTCKAKGMKICFASVEEAFDGHEAYSKNPYIKEICFRQAQDLKGPVSAYSMHPNDNGAQIYADCVQAKIDEIESDGGKTEWPEMTSSDERDIALVLDVSGSMSGTPMVETRKASDKFINTILKEDASIGIVTYDSSSMCLSDFCMNEGYLSNIVQNINSGGGTNMEAGLDEAYSMLKSSNAKKKIIVLMSDGEPNEGKVGEELINYAKKIKNDDVYIYTLGFFNSVSDKTGPQSLLESISSDGCHFEVENADDLVFFFGDIADQINGQKYIYVRIACPVDVSVKYKGETLCSAEDGLNTRTAFGSLTFEDNKKKSGESSDNRVKILRLKEGADYDIKIEGNGGGYMDYTIGFMDKSGEYSDLREFSNIEINRRTVIDTVAKTSDSTILNVDQDGDGKYDLKYKAGKNGMGRLVDNTYIIYIVIGCAAFIVILTVFIIIKKSVKSKRNA